MHRRRGALEVYLTPLHRHKRARFIKSLIERVVELASQPATNGTGDYDEGISESVGSMIACAYRIAGNPALWKQFVRLGGMSRYAYALDTMAKRAERSKSIGVDSWNRVALGITIISGCVLSQTLQAARRLPSPPHLAELVSGGFFLSCIRRCLKHCDESGAQAARKALWNLLPHLFLCKVFSAVDPHERAEEWGAKMWSVPTELAAATVDEFNVVMTFSEWFHRNPKHVNVCSNRTVSIRTWLEHLDIS